MPYACLKRTAARTGLLLRTGVLAGFFGISVVNPALCLALQLPPIVEPASQEHHVGKVIFLELVTPDLDAAKQFYGKLFGWTFHDIDIGNTQYAEAIFDGHSVAGLIYKEASPSANRQPAWLSFIAVRDVDSAKNIALQHGAKVLFEPHSLPERGRQAIFADPQGAVFAVLASSSGDPPDVLVAPGEWIWSSLITSDPQGAAIFYQTLFQYEIFDAPSDDGGRHVMLASDNFARASVNSMPEKSLGNHSHWLNYIRVEDAVEMSAKAVALGGRMLVEPRVDRHGGRIAVVADPQGAPFGLLEWTDIDSKVVNQ
jgi:predicted enzyme related to lactoylglutathione lyase